MRKIKYLFQRITRMDYKRFFQTINAIHKKTNKNRIFLFFDSIYCGFKYQAGYLDYQLFEMYNLNKEQRKTIITRGINNEFIRRFNDKSFTHIFSNKLEFNQRFSKYLKRDWLELTNNNYAEFQQFIQKHPNIIAKPVDGTCGKGIEKLQVKPKEARSTYEHLLANQEVLVEEVATQCEAINKLHPYSINTLRIVTLKQEVVAAYIRIGNHQNCVDNFNSDGLAAPINIETGIIDYPAIDKHDHIYERHPLTNEPILWLTIPKWEKIKEFCIKAAKEIPEVGYIGWDVCVRDDGPLLIEGNDFPGHDIYQLPPHRTNNQGMLPIFEKVINKGESK